MYDRQLRHMVILCHPEQDSFNASVAKAYCAAVHERGHEALVRDLYGMGFHPVLKSTERPGEHFREFSEVEQELDILEGTDVFVLVYPIWFGGPPAMLKGYIERVLGSGVVPQSVHDRDARGVLAGKRLVSFTSSALAADWLDQQGQLQAVITGFDRYIEHAFGMQPSEHHHVGGIVAGVTSDVIDRHLHDVRAQAHAIAEQIEARTGA